MVWDCGNVNRVLYRGCLFSLKQPLCGTRELFRSRHYLGRRWKVGWEELFWGSLAEEVCSAAFPRLLCACRFLKMQVALSVSPLCEIKASPKSLNLSFLSEAAWSGLFCKCCLKGVNPVHHESPALPSGLIYFWAISRHLRRFVGGQEGHYPWTSIYQNAKGGGTDIMCPLTPEWQNRKWHHLAL